MSTENQMADSNVTTPRVLTGFIYYNETDDLSKIFEVIKDFRTRHGLKYTHYKGYIFFMLLSDFMGEFSKVRPFRISKFKSSSEYTCSKEVADKLIEQRNSFIKVKWDEAGYLVFMSRTKTFFHNYLVRKLFKDAEMELNQELYKVNRFTPENNDKEQENVVMQNNTEPVKSEFTKIEKRGRKPLENKDNVKPKSKYTPKDKNVFKQNDNVEEVPKIRGKRVGTNKNKQA
jgi:hypothetical protein